MDSSTPEHDAPSPEQQNESTDLQRSQAAQIADLVAQGLRLRQDLTDLRAIVVQLIVRVGELEARDTRKL